HRTGVGNHGALYVTRHQDFALQPPLALHALGIEAGVDDRDAQVVGDVFEQPGVVPAEGVAAAAFERDHSDDPILVTERDGDFRTPPAGNFILGVIVGVERDVADDHRLSFAHGAPDNALGHVGAADFVGAGFAVTFLDVPDEFLVLLINQADQQVLVINDAAEQRRDAAEQVIEVENRTDLTPDFDQRLHLAAALAQFVIHPRVFERDRQVIAQNVQDARVFGREVIRLRAFNRQHAHRAAFAGE